MAEVSNRQGELVYHILRTANRDILASKLSSATNLQGGLRQATLSLSPSHLLYGDNTDLPYRTTDLSGKQHGQRSPGCHQEDDQDKYMRSASNT